MRSFDGDYGCDDGDCFDASFDDCFDASLDEDMSIQYDEVFAKGFVKTVLDKKYKLEDSVTVVFNIK